MLAYTAIQVAISGAAAVERSGRSSRIPGGAVQVNTRAVDEA